MNIKAITAFLILSAGCHDRAVDYAVIHEVDAMDTGTGSTSDAGEMTESGDSMGTDDQHGSGGGSGGHEQRSCIDALDGQGCLCNGLPNPVERCSYPCGETPTMRNGSCLCGNRPIDPQWCGCDALGDTCDCFGLSLPWWFCD